MSKNGIDLKESPTRQMRRAAEVLDNTEASSLERCKYFDVLIFTLFDNWYFLYFILYFSSGVCWIEWRVGISAPGSASSPHYHSESSLPPLVPNFDQSYQIKTKTKTKTGQLKTNFEYILKLYLEYHQPLRFKKCILQSLKVSSVPLLSISITFS